MRIAKKSMFNYLGKLIRIVAKDQDKLLSELNSLKAYLLDLEKEHDKLREDYKDIVRYVISNK